MQYSGPHRPFEINLKEIVGEKAVVTKDKIYKEIKLGRIARPFHFPPFPTIRISPISVILKRSSSEYRLIHNLSFPEHVSFNDFIDKELCIVKYSTIDDAIKMIHKLGKNTKLVKCDIKSAFRLLRLSPGDFDLMGLNLKISISSSNVYPWERTLVVHYSRNFNSFTLVRSAGVK